MIIGIFQAPWWWEGWYNLVFVRWGRCTVAPFERFRALSQFLSKPLVPLSALICNRTRGIWFSYEGWNTGDAVCSLLPRAIHLGPARQKKKKKTQTRS